MTQSTDLTLANQSGAAYRSEHNSINQALGSNHKGNSEPSYILTGMTWINDSASPWVYNVYDGADNIEIGRIDATGNKFSVQANLIDSNGNEILEHTATSSAVNHISITNAATGNGATLSSAGDDTDVDLNITTKGTGVVNFDKEVAFPDSGELTISSGAITVTGVNHTVDTEADAASDDLATISGGTDGQILILRAENAARTVVLKDGTGNIETPDGEDITLDETEKEVVLKYDGAASAWHVLSQPATAVNQRLLCTAWVQFDGTGTPTIADDEGFSSITDVGQGIYRANFTTNMDNTNYAAVATVEDENNSSNTPWCFYSGWNNVAYVEIRTFANNGSLNDAEDVCVVVFGGLA